MNQLWVTLRPHLPFMLDGFLLTVLACTLAIIGAVVIGALMASLRTSGNRIVRGVAFAYSDVFRNTPFIVQLFFFFYGLPEIGIYIGAFETGVIALSIIGGAFVSDVIRSGILAVDQGVIEAAKVSGLSRWTIFTKIVLPIALRTSVRPMGSVLINMVLTSSILSTITINELTGTAKIVASTTFKPFEVYLVLLVLYATLTYALSLLINTVHRRLNRAMDTGGSA